MTDHSNDLIQDVLVDSDLAKRILPNKFKHTSKQGRARRQKLLLAAKELCFKQDIASITLADVCKRAGIPRASAYHFFPNIESIIIALRFLNYLEYYELINAIDIHDYEGWQDYVDDLLRIAVKRMNSDGISAKLMYAANLPDFEGYYYDEKVDKDMCDMVLTKIRSKFNLDDIEELETLFLISYGIAHSVLGLSYKQSMTITDYMLDECVTACLAYMKCYIPENPTLV